ncbi:MAG: hypothetical protein AAGA35_04290 [Patescibacteria group bacterium]
MDLEAFKAALAERNVCAVGRASNAQGWLYEVEALINEGKTTMAQYLDLVDCRQDTGGSKMLHGCALRAIEADAKKPQPVGGWAVLD